MPNPSPTVRRRRLARLMKEFREASGRSREAAAEHAGIAPITVTRIETGRHAPNASVVMELCHFYGIERERAEAMAGLARQARKRGWWVQHGATIPDWFEIYVGLESEVAEIRSYQPEVIFGLFQTEGYIRGLMASEASLGQDERERRILLRLQRQKLLTVPDAPKLWVVLNEAAVRRIVGGVGPMREQLEQLARLSTEPNITIQVLPFSAGAHPGNDGSFNVLRFPEAADPDVAYVQYRLGSIILEEAPQVREYIEVFDQLRARALGPDESRSLINKVAREMS
jgi:DNA-binding XRE family transcriptional regulator